MLRASVLQASAVFSDSHVMLCLQRAQVGHLQSFVQELVEKADQPESAVMEAASAPDVAHSLTCIVCLDNDVDTVFVPCGHTCCGGCASRIMTNGRQTGRGLQCHACRARIEQHCTFFLP